jgi:hypothetical protein
MKLYQRLEQLSRWLKYQATYLEMEYHLKQVLKGKEYRYMKDVFSYDRGTGKSVALARLSAKYNLPIIVYTNMAKKHIEDIPQKLPKYFRKRKPLVLVCHKEKLRGRRFDVVLLDQELSAQQMNDLYEVGLTNKYVGFRYYY